MKGIPKITLEPANIVCLKCGSPNYMRHLIGEGVGELDVKCINCNSYFNFDELYRRRIGEVLKPKPITNYDRIVSKSPGELAEWLAEVLFHCSNTICDQRCPMYECCCDQPSDNIEDWLKQEAKE